MIKTFMCYGMNTFTCIVLVKNLDFKISCFTLGQRTCTLCKTQYSETNACDLHIYVNNQYSLDVRCI